MRRHLLALALGLAATASFAAHAGHRDIAVSIAVPGLSVSYGPGWGIAVAPPVYAPAPVHYYEPVVRPAPVYYYGRPVVYAPPVRYVAPRPVVVVPRYGHPGWHGHHGGHGPHRGHGHAGHGGAPGHWR